MYSLSEITEPLGRDRLTVLGWMKRFELPEMEDRKYPESFLPFLRTISFLRLAQVTEARILELWTVERKLMTVLHADPLGSPTWMIDGHDQSGHRNRRLFLSRFDLGADLTALALQPGLDFSETDAELFAVREMGEDALRLLGSYLKLVEPIHRSLREQAPILAAASRWARRVGGSR